MKQCFLLVLLFDLSASAVLNQAGRIYLENVDADAAESIAIDSDNSLIFTANGNALTIDVISFAPTSANIAAGDIPMLFEAAIDVETAISNQFANANISDITSIKYCSGKKSVFATVVPANVAQDFGYLVVVDAEQQNIQNIIALTDCYLPDHVTTTSDCANIIISCEGEPDDNEAEFPAFNPPGSVCIVNADNYDVHNVVFDAFNDAVFDGLIYEPHIGEPFSVNVEPEYAVVDDEDKYAFIVLQENNGIAILDIAGKEIVDIFSLGTRDFSVHGLDASDKDGMVNMLSYPNLFGLRMPDGIDFMTQNGKQYILTANEGDSKDFDEARVGGITLNNAAFSNINIAQLQSELVMGRLKIINQLGKNAAGEFEQLFAFSSRDFTIWEIKKSEDGSNSITGIELTFSSMSEFEEITAAQIPQGFNSNYDFDSFDQRSDDKGPEAEAVVVGKCNERMFSFVGLERVSGIMVYDVTEPAESFWVEYFNSRNFNVSFVEDTRPPSEAGDFAPEQFVFVGVEVYGTPLLFATYTYSSSIAIYTVNCGEDDDAKGHGVIGNVHFTFVFVLYSSFCIFIL